MQVNKITFAGKQQVLNEATDKLHKYVGRNVELKSEQEIAQEAAEVIEQITSMQRKPSINTPIVSGDYGYVSPRTIFDSKAAISDIKKVEEKATTPETTEAKKLAKTILDTPFRHYREPFQIENVSAMNAKAAQIEYAKAQGKPESYVK